MTDHIITRNKLKSIPRIDTFNDLINASTLSDVDKQILVLHYLQDKDLRYIGDMLGYAESTMKKRHKRILSKLKKII